MDRLVIPVNDSIAGIWKSASAEQKAQIVTVFCWLIEHEQWQNVTSDSFANLLDNISDKAIMNGLTPELLEEILHES
jgi:hypothetical protein